MIRQHLGDSGVGGDQIVCGGSPSMHGLGRIPASLDLTREVGGWAVLGRRFGGA